MGTRVSAEAAAIAREAQMRSEASEAARIAYVTQARTLRERRGSYIKMVIISALVAVICSRLRGTVGALGFSISTGLVIWGVVDAVMLTNQIKVLDKRAMDMTRARDAAAAEHPRLEHHTDQSERPAQQRRERHPQRTFQESGLPCVSHRGIRTGKASSVRSSRGRPAPCRP